MLNFFVSSAAYLYENIQKIFWKSIEVKIYICYLFDLQLKIGVSNTYHKAEHAQILKSDCCDQRVGK